MRTATLLVVLFVLAGCSTGINAKTAVPNTDLTIGTTLSLANRTASVSLNSASCGVIGDGVITLNTGPAACFAAQEGTSLIGQIQNAVTKPAAK